MDQVVEDDVGAGAATVAAESVAVGKHHQRRRFPRRIILRRNIDCVLTGRSRVERRIGEIAAQEFAFRDAVLADRLGRGGVVRLLGGAQVTEGEEQAKGWGQMFHGRRLRNIICRAERRQAALERWIGGAPDTNPQRWRNL